MLSAKFFDARTCARGSGCWILNCRLDLQRPDGLAADDRAHGAAFELPAVEGGVAAAGEACSLSTVHSRSGLMSVTSPGAPTERVPRSRLSRRAGSRV